MTGQEPKLRLWWIAEALLLAVSYMAALMLITLLLTRLLHWLGLIGDYSIPDLYLDDGEKSALVLTCVVFVPVLLVLLPRLRRGR